MAQCLYRDLLFRKFCRIELRAGVADATTVEAAQSGEGKGEKGKPVRDPAAGSHVKRTLIHGKDKGMRIEAENSETGKTFSEEAPDLNESTLEELTSFELSEQEIHKRIDNLDINADCKQKLHAATRITIKAGRTVIWIGHKILDQVMFLLRTFPTTSFGLIFGAVVGYLISTIPVIGFVLGPLVTVILMALLGGHGVIQDIKDILLRRSVNEARGVFNPLQTA